MLAKIFAEFLHYYEARGKEEIKSFLLTFLGTFSTVFLILGNEGMTALIAGAPLETAFMILAPAVVRSFWAALFYSIWPDKFKFRVTGEK